MGGKTGKVGLIPTNPRQRRSVISLLSRAVLFSRVIVSLFP